MDKRGAPKKSIDKAAIGSRIREARKHACLTQEDLACAVGRKDKKTISDWERGISTPTKKTIKKIATVCGVPYEAIFTAEDVHVESLSKTVAHSKNILADFNPIEYHYSTGVKKAFVSTDWSKVSFSFDDLERFEAFIESSAKNSIEFFINNLTEKRKD